MGFSMQEYWSGVPLPSPIVTGEVLPWICHHEFSSYFSTFVIIMASLREPCPLPSPDPWGRVPLFGSQGDRLTLSTHERLWFSCVLCVGNASPCLLLTSVAYLFRITDSCGIFIYWYDRRYSISHHLRNDSEDVKLTHPPAWSLPFWKIFARIKWSFYFVYSSPPIYDP